MAETTNENSHPKMPQLDGVGMMKCLYSLLNTVGGKMTITKHTLDNMPTDWMKRMIIEPVPQLGAYRISIAARRQRGIIKPKKRLIIPN